MASREVPRRPAERLDGFIAACGWDIAGFARICDLDKAHAWRFVKRKQTISMAAAIKIANALREAKARGEVPQHVELVTAGELCPALLAYAANAAAPATGTKG